VELLVVLQQIMWRNSATGSFLHQPRQQTKEGIAENSMEQLEKHANVTHERVQVCFINLNLEESKMTARFQ